MSTDTLDALPFTKLKPGMLVRFRYGLDAFDGRVISKHNGSQTLKLADMADQLHTVAHADILGVLPPNPLDQIHPMLAKNVEDYANVTVEDLLTSDQWDAENKYDGERGIGAYFPAANMLTFRATTRVVGKNTGLLGVNTGKLPHLVSIPVPMDGPTVFDWELMHDGGFQQLRSIMGSDDALALEKQEEHGYVYAIVFDVIWFNGLDLRRHTREDRRAILEAWYEGVESQVDDRLLLSPVARGEAAKRDLLQQVVDSGGEGIMLKHRLGKYTDTTVPGRRSAEVLKVKPFTADEVVILGFVGGQGEYNTDKYGAIRFAQWVPRSKLTPDMDKNRVAQDTRAQNGVQRLLRDAVSSGHYTDYELVDMGTCGGFTQEQEEKFRLAPDSYVGQVMEVKFQQRWPKTGQMRHPNFLRMRTDKPAEQCIYHPREA